MKSLLWKRVVWCLHRAVPWTLLSSFFFLLSLTSLVRLFKPIKYLLNMVETGVKGAQRTHFLQPAPWQEHVQGEKYVKKSTIMICFYKSLIAVIKRTLGTKGIWKQDNSITNEGSEEDLWRKFPKCCVWVAWIGGLGLRGVWVPDRGSIDECPGSRHKKARCFQKIWDLHVRWGMEGIHKGVDGWVIWRRY